jgi:maltose O-acetyltransferase
MNLPAALKAHLCQRGPSLGFRTVAMYSDRMGVITSFWLNALVGSPIVHSRIRRVLLLVSGMNARDLRMFSGVRWAGSTDVTFGDSVFVNTGVLFDACAPISIGRKVHLGHDVRLLTATHRLGPASSRAAGVAFAPIRVGDGAWIGAAVTVLSGVTIGEGCVVAAGAVVVRDCEPNGLYGGIPARRLRDLDDATVDVDVNDPCAASSLTRDI